jgi:hypothetical protein
VEENIEKVNSDVQYSIIIKDKFNEDLLALQCVDGISCPYPPTHVKVITPPQENIKEQSITREKYENEYRLVVQVSCEKEIRDDYIETILELCILPAGCEQDGIFTYDTIRCGISKEIHSISCNNIYVNGSLVWEKSNDKVEPFIKLEREPCLGDIVCSKE